MCATSLLCTALSYTAILGMPTAAYAQARKEEAHWEWALCLVASTAQLASHPGEMPWSEMPKFMKLGKFTPSTYEPSPGVTDGYFKKKAEEAKIMFLIIFAILCKV